jgi:hypothetical protein
MILIPLLVSSLIILIVISLLLVLINKVEKEEFNRALNQKERFINFQYEEYLNILQEKEFMTLAAQSIHDIVTKSVFYNEKTNELITFQDLDYIGEL